MADNIFSPLIPIKLNKKIGRKNIEIMANLISAFEKRKLEVTNKNINQMTFKISVA